MVRPLARRGWAFAFFLFLFLRVFVAGESCLSGLYTAEVIEANRLLRAVYAREVVLVCAPRQPWLRRQRPPARRSSKTREQMDYYYCCLIVTQESQAVVF